VHQLLAAWGLTAWSLLRLLSQLGSGAARRSGSGVVDLAGLGIGSAAGLAAAGALVFASVLSDLS
tara:strand:- start:39 stop:233 length:195 start_codon:yes stop_codon:yes gene_type:complete